MRSVFRPLGSRSFRRLWPAQISNIFGYWLADIALAVVVFDRTRSAIATAALFLANMFLPALISPAVVARLEALPVRRSLPTVFGLAAAVVGVLALVAERSPLPVILALAAAVGVFTMSGRALIRASAAAILKPIGELRSGNALFNISFTWGWFIAPAVAGLAVAETGPRGALLIGAGVLLLGGTALLGVRGLPHADQAAVHWRKRLREGVGYVRRHVTLRPLFVAIGVFVVFTDIIWPLEVVLVKGTLGGGDAAYGIFVACWGAGMAIGGLWFTVVRGGRLHGLLLSSVVLLGVAFVATALAPNLIVANVAQLIGGFGNGFQWVALVTLIQEMTLDGFQARVQSLLESIISGMQGLGFVLGGVLGAVFSARFGFLVAGVSTLLLAAGAGLVMRDLPWGADAAQEGSRASQATPDAVPAKSET